MNGVKTVSVSVDVVADMLTTGYEANNIRCIKGIPADARYISGHVDNKDGRIVLMFEHPDWEMPPAKTPYERLPVTMTTWSGEAEQ